MLLAKRRPGIDTWALFVWRKGGDRGSAAAVKGSFCRIHRGTVDFIRKFVYNETILVGIKKKSVVIRRESPSEKMVVVKFDDIIAGCVVCLRRRGGRLLSGNG